MVMPPTESPPSALQRHSGWDCTTELSCEQQDLVGAVSFPLMYFKHGYRPTSATVHPDCADADATSVAATTARKRHLALIIAIDFPLSSP
jgi:hypothetical protein